MTTWPTGLSVPGVARPCHRPVLRRGWFFENGVVGNGGLTITSITTG